MQERLLRVKVELQQLVTPSSKLEPVLMVRCRRNNLLSSRRKMQRRKKKLLVKANSHACLLQRIRPYGRGVERLTLRVTIATLDCRDAFDLFDRGVE